MSKVVVLWIRNPFIRNLIFIVIYQSCWERLQSVRILGGDFCWKIPELQNLDLKNLDSENLESKGLEV